MKSIAADWVLPVSSPPLADHAVEIGKDGRIQAVRPATAADTRLHGACLMPGLVNVHAHLAYTAMHGKFDGLPFFTWIRRLTEEKKTWTESRVRASERLGIVQTLLSGITCVADLSDWEPALDVLSGSPLRGTFYMEVFGVETAQADASWEYLRATYPRLRSRHAGDRIDVGVSPHSCYTVRPELFRLISGWALENHVPVSFHLAESREEEQFIRERSGPIADALRHRTSDWQFTAGAGSVSHVEKTGILGTHPLLAHLVQASHEDIALLRSFGVSIAHCPRSNAQLGHGVAPLTAFLAGGMPVGLGTDSAASNDSLDLLEEGRFVLSQQGARQGRTVVSEEQILQMWTLSGARAMNLADRVGSLDTGKEADIVAFDVPRHCNTPEKIVCHLVRHATPADLRMVMIAGREVDLSSLVEEKGQLTAELGLP